MRINRLLLYPALLSASLALFIKYGLKVLNNSIDNEYGNWVIGTIHGYLENQICFVILVMFLFVLFYAFFQYMTICQLQGIFLKNPLTLRRRIVNNVSRFFLSKNKMATQSKLKNSELDKVNLRETKNIYDNELYIIHFGIWVLPVLGFLGTVIGISQSIKGLDIVVKSNTMATHGGGSASIKSGMETVLSGLTTAFDTTFLGLFFSIFIMVILIFLRQKISSMIDYEIIHIREDPTT